MTCDVCGAPVPSAEQACPTCGAPGAAAAAGGIADPRAVVVPSSAPPPPTPRRPWVSTAVMAVTAGVAVVLLAMLVLDRGAGDDVVTGPSTTATLAPTAPAPTPATTMPPTTMPPATMPATTMPAATMPPATMPPATMPPAEPGPQPTAPLGDPYTALDQWAAGLDLDLRGLCDSLDSLVDYGPDPWCATLAVDRGAELVYRVADFPGGDFAVWVLLVLSDQGWEVADTADDLAGVIPF